MDQPGGIGFVQLLEYAFFCYFYSKCYQMIPEVKLRISLQELSSRGSRIIAQQSGISYEQAILQVQQLSQTSKVKQSLKKSRLSS